MKKLWTYVYVGLTAFILIGLSLEKAVAQCDINVDFDFINGEELCTGQEQCVLAVVTDSGNQGVPNIEVIFKILTGPNTATIPTMTGITGVDGTVEFCYLGGENPGSETIEITANPPKDELPPSLLLVPADLTLNCNDLLPDPTEVTAEDNCDENPNITFNEIEAVGVCPIKAILTRTWTATDAEGNNTTAQQTITFIDEAPVLDCTNLDVSISCGDNINNQPQPTATDDCTPANELIITFSDDPSNLAACGDQGFILRTFTATDACGLTATCRQTITVINEAPLFDCTTVANIEITCADDISNIPAPTVTDDCTPSNEIILAFNDNNSGLNAAGDQGIIIRTYTATDACGRSSICVQTITITNNPPTINCTNLDVTIACDADRDAIALGQPTSHDDCSPVAEINLTSVDDESNFDGCQGFIIRIFTATDESGNSNSCSQTITIQDSTEPTLANVPADATVECDDIPAEPTNVTATDNCDDDVTVHFNEERTNGDCPDSYTLTRTWTATDNCGNVSTGIQVIIIQDSTEPTLANVPADATVECDEIPFLPNITSTDNCDADVQVDLVEIRTNGDCEDSYTLVRTWTATDNCGNTTNRIQVITVDDTTNPTLENVPADITVTCDNIPPPPIITAIDNCDSNVDVTLNEVSTNSGCAVDFTIVRTWTATDNCGNSADVNQVITVQASNGPAINLQKNGNN